MPEQNVKAGELNKAKDVFDVVLPSGDEARSGASKRRAVPLSTVDDSGVACVRPEFDFGAAGSARSIRCGIRQRVFGRARQSHWLCRRRGGQFVEEGAGENLFHKLALGWRSALHRYGERKAVSSGDSDDLRTLAETGRADAEAPFLALAKVASTNASSRFN
jgi:hypothetical protein